MNEASGSGENKDAVRSVVIDLADVSYGFGGADRVLDNLSFQVGEGEFVAVVGPSGCGKTTLLNLLAGDMMPVSGTVTVRGAARRVFQQDGLFPWSTVRDNIALGLRQSAPETRERETDVLLDLIGLREFAGHYPHQLSGGMRQRVELARALSGPSDILLMDEPFSAVDYLTRLRLRQELARLLAEKPRTVVLVTHDIEEAVQLSDRVIVLSKRPARVCLELPITLPRPRTATDPAALDAVRRILTELGV